MHIYIYTTIERALRARIGLRNNIAELNYGRYIEAGILGQIYRGRYIMAGILRQIYYGKYITADVLWQVYQADILRHIY